MSTIQEQRQQLESVRRKLKYIAIIIIIILAIGLIIYFNIPKETITIKDTKPKQYQGAVPEGYNETHFRETGETIPDYIIKETGQFCSKIKGQAREYFCDEMCGIGRYTGGEDLIYVDDKCINRKVVCYCKEV